MFLKQLTLKNFRCLEDVSIDFQTADDKIRKTTLLIGENGTGKSNLLKAIAIITAGSDALAEIIKDDVDSLILLGKKQATIQAVLLTKAGEERNLKLVFERGDKMRDVLSRAHDTLDEIDRALEYTDRNYFVAGYGASRRINNRENLLSRKSSRMMRYASIQTLFDPNAVLNPLESWAVDLDYTLGSKGVDIVKKTLNEFMQSVEFSHIDKSTKKLMFQTPDGLIPLNQLSDGYQSLAAWVGDLLFRITDAFEDYSSPLKARGLLLIDEVDLHLHPKWQRILLHFFKTKLPNFQIIATTHSVLTAQQAENDELLYLTRTGSEVHIKDFHGAPSNLQVSQLLTSPAFGLETDESYEHELLLERHSQLEEMTDRGPKEEKELEEVKAKLRERPDRNFQSDLELEQLALLKKISKHYD